MIPVDLLTPHIQSHPYPLLFATISGAHLYGFPSPDSDWDLRGVHILPLSDAIGINAIRETVENAYKDEGLDVDLVTHDIRKFMCLMLKRNGYVLEQLLSPLVLQSSPEHEELKSISKKCISRHHANHYLGFAATQWNLFQKDQSFIVKPLLYTFRVLLTGIHLMRTGTIEANLIRLNEETRLPYVDDLIAQKVNGSEKVGLQSDNIAFFESEYLRLRAILEDEYQSSHLPDAPKAHSDLNDLLCRIRLAAQ